MDIGIFRGLITLVLFIAFCGVVVWAWSAKRKDDFIEAASLPLDENIASIELNKRDSRE